MKTATRPQYHRLQRILEMIREGTRTGSLPNCGHFIRELTRAALSTGGRAGSKFLSLCTCWSRLHDGRECHRGWLS